MDSSIKYLSRNCKIWEEYATISTEKVVAVYGSEFSELKILLNTAVDFADLEGTASAATPVPGGVGGVTTAVLAQHLVRAAWMKQEKNSNK